MKYFSLITLIIGTLLLPFSTRASQDYEVIICNQCQSNNDFEMLVRSLDSAGDYVVVNMETKTVKSFMAIYEPYLGGMLAIPIDNPDEVTRDAEEANQIMDAWNDLKAYMENPLNNSPNGCGGEDSMLNPLIPQGPYIESCNRHDMCFAEGKSLSYCNEAFLADMQSIIDAELAKNIPTDRYIYNIKYNYLKNLRDNFYRMVEKYGIIYYCQDGLNSDTPECIAFDDEFEGEIMVIGSAGEVTRMYQAVGGGLELNIVCDRVAYQVLIEGVKGDIHVMENCRTVPSRNR